ncbi:MAG: fused MFS/spermidine synthase [Candidatus Omnitrophica bacterium]|nr:fused MFS/spermidine synthase [Candidatus Omnitrophota bacterium]
MNNRRRIYMLGLVVMLLAGTPERTIPAEADVVFETTSPYHHIRVLDHEGLRTLSFDGSMETRMSLRDPLEGQFEYTEYFHLPWLWNDKIKEVLMIGLGGGSTQKAYQHRYPDVMVDSAELDPAVVQIARDYFYLKESPSLRIHISDGRTFLRRSQKKYDVIVMDAYTANRYGSFLPYSLTTREFFKLAGDHLSTNGVLAYNVIGSLHGSRANIVGSMYRTLKSVFPQVYLFPASSSRNVVFVATKSSQSVSLPQLQQQAAELVRQGRRLPPNIRDRINAFRIKPPLAANRSPLLSDDYAPIDGLLQTTP